MKLPISWWGVLLIQLISLGSITELLVNRGMYCKQYRTGFRE